MAQLGLLWALGALTALAGAVQRSFEVNVWPRAPMVEYGGSLWINCSNTCSDPSVKTGLETSLTKAQSERGPGWEAFHLANITEWASAPMCFVTCYGSFTTVSVNISAYRALEQVVLEPLPELKVGQAYNLTCRVLNVAPIRHLTVTLRQGGQTLHTEIFQNDTRTRADNIMVTHTITPQQRDHGQEATCYADLNLSPHGPRFSKTSTGEKFRVHGPPEMDNTSCPSNQIWVEGTQQNFSCRAWGNPESTVVCRKDGASHDIRLPRLVSRQDAGTYHCIATNNYDQTSREVTVQVQYDDDNLLLIILVTLLVVIPLLLVTGSVYYLHYRKQKMGKYDVKKTNQGKQAEKSQLCSNGAAQDAPEAEHGV